MEWGRDRLESELAAMRARRGDTTAVEVKRAREGMPSTLDRTLCAFANMPSGGTIILGVDEKSGFVLTGIDDIPGLERAITDCNRHRVDPAPILTFETIDVDGVDVLVVTVAPLPVMEKPARVDGVAYLRQADGEYPMHAHELRMVEVERLHVYDRPAFDERPLVGTDLNDLDPELVERFGGNVRARVSRLREASDVDILRRYGALTADGLVTIAGLTALGDFPQGRLPALTVTAAVRDTSSRGERQLRNKRDFTGPIPVMLADIMEWVREVTPTSNVYDERGHMHEVPELPLRAVRELVANALVHRDLGPDTLEVGQSVQIRLDPRQMYIVSPGGLRGVSLEELANDEQHSQAAVNQRLYQICKYLTTDDGASVIEGEGGGLIEVRRAAQQWGLPMPTLSNTGVRVTAHLWRPQGDEGRVVGVPTEEHSRATETHRTQQAAPAVDRSASARHVSTERKLRRHEPAVLAALADGSRSLGEIAAQTGLAPHQVRYALANALERGAVEMNGRQGSRATRYSLTTTSRP